MIVREYFLNILCRFSALSSLSIIHFSNSFSSISKESNAYSSIFKESNSLSSISKENNIYPSMSRDGLIRSLKMVLLLIYSFPVFQARFLKCQ